MPTVNALVLRSLSIVNRGVNRTSFPKGSCMYLSDFDENEIIKQMVDEDFEDDDSIEGRG